MKVTEDYLGNPLIVDDAGDEILMTPYPGRSHVSPVDVRDAAQLQAVRGELSIRDYSIVLRQTWECMDEADRAADMVRAEAAL